MNLLLTILLANPGPPGVDRVEFTTILAAPFCSAERETVVVCASEDDLIKAISDFGISEKMNIMTDFSQNLLVMAFLGKRSTAGYAIEPVAVYSVFYNEAGVNGNSIWKSEVVPLLESDGLDPEAVPVKPIEEEGDAVLVAREKCPAPGAMLAQVITSPYVIIEVPRAGIKKAVLSVARCPK